MQTRDKTAKAIDATDATFDDTSADPSGDTPAEPSVPPHWGGIGVFLSTGIGFDAPTAWRASSIKAPVISGGTANLAAD